MIPDQWQVQIQAQIQERATVVMHTGFLSDEELAQAHLAQTRDIAATVREALDRGRSAARRSASSLRARRRSRSSPAPGRRREH